jgi:hypothetical protein
LRSNLTENSSFARTLSQDMVQTDKFYQSGGVLNLNPREFERWCQTLNLPAATVEAIAKIRSAPPSRRVQGRASNVSGTYPSQKMALTIQFESHKVERSISERSPNS